MSMRNGREDGASAVEFALIFPLLAMLMFGMISGGLALNQQQQINHAAREASRFGATLPGFPAGSDEDTFNLVANRAVVTAVNQLNRADAFLCVTYWDGDTPTRRWYAGNAPGSPLGSAPAGLPCGDLLNGGADTEPRIQVNAYLPGRIEAIFVRRDVTMTAQAVSVYEPVS